MRARGDGLSLMADIHNQGSCGQPEPRDGLAGSSRHTGCARPTWMGGANVHCVFSASGYIEQR